MATSETAGLPEWKPPLVKGIHKYLIGSLIRLHIILIAFAHYVHPTRVILVLKKLEYLRRQYMGDFKICKLIKVNGRYYWDMHAPGWPSAAFVKYNEGEMNRIIPFRKKTYYLNSMILAITKKCPLRCAHCYEWDILNDREKLSLDNLKVIIEKFQFHGKGVAQIQLSGGEPLSRYDDMISLLKTACKGTDFWMVTCGVGLTLKKAKELKKAGLRGIAISLDHFDPYKHNAFRGSDEAFPWVIRAIGNAHQAGLVVILSLCPVKEFISSENMMKYAQLAKRLGAAFILIIEPRAVGHFEMKDVKLNAGEVTILEDFFLKMNYDPAFADMPAVSYHGFHQRRTGCFGGGNRYLYIDTDGNMHLCPFCRQNFGNVLMLSVRESMELIRKEHCFEFKSATI
ncbi:MAG TPA: radical SAM protein [Bacteroidales bacterium]|nr:radical SAM protein [Bacteroidales bacterium]HNS47360.1 radical SAM protein [Bacteroidales bacterium]